MADSFARSMRSTRTRRTSAAVGASLWTGLLGIGMMVVGWTVLMAMALSGALCVGPAEAVQMASIPGALAALGLALALFGAAGIDAVRRLDLERLDPVTMLRSDAPGEVGIASVALARPRPRPRF